jgi:hypothetical protein
MWGAGMTNANHALQRAAAGAHVFVTDKTKRPLVMWRNLSTTDPATIRQKADWPHQEEDDAVIIVARSNIDTFVDRLTNLLGYGRLDGRRR